VKRCSRAGELAQTVSHERNEIRRTTPASLDLLEREPPAELPVVRAAARAERLRRADAHALLAVRIRRIDGAFARSERVAQVLVDAHRTVEQFHRDVTLCATGHVRAFRNHVDASVGPRVSKNGYALSDAAIVGLEGLDDGGRVVVSAHACRCRHIALRAPPVDCAESYGRAPGAV